MAGVEQAQPPWGETCADNDGDGYGNPASEACQHSEWDCNDNNAAVNPAATEGPYGDPTCSDTLDNDCDGLVDAADEGCRPTRPLPDTGINQCYDNEGPITCPAPGEPYFGQDAQYVTNLMSFTDNLDGTITDNVTGLIWQKLDDDIMRSQQDAIAYCENLPLADYSDWRLPDEYELQSIVDYGRYDPAIEPSYFPGTSGSRYWSSSPYEADYGWCVNFSDGYVYWDWMTNAHYVRCVRGESVEQSLTDNGDGTVTDNVTGRMWQQEDDNQRRFWIEALGYCENLTLAGHTDWRLPDIKELFTIRKNIFFFPGTDMYFYWSSSTNGFYTSLACVVDFVNGYATTHGNKALNDFSVRCVR
jgi:hypothetical protein